MDVLDMLGRNIHLSRHYPPSVDIQKLEFSLPAWSSCLESLQIRAGKSELPLKDVVMTTPRADAGTCPCDMMPEAQRDAKFFFKRSPPTLSPDAYIKGRRTSIPQSRAPNS